MDTENKLVDFTSLQDMLYGEEKYIIEFAEAAIISFTEFSRNYTTYLHQHNETDFRKAGHKIKPVAKMLGIEQIIDEYEHGKTLIWDEKPEEDLKESSEKITCICDEVIDELQQIISNI